MIIAEIKEKIAEKLKTANDELVLEEVYRLLDNEQGQSVIVTEELKQAVAEGMTDYKAGKTVSHEELKEEIRKWLTQ
jgi:predicted transcriptional regulator